MFYLFSFHLFKTISVLSKQKKKIRHKYSCNHKSDFKERSERGDRILTTWWLSLDEVSIEQILASKQACLLGVHATKQTHIIGLPPPCLEVRSRRLR